MSNLEYEQAGRIEYRVFTLFGQVFLILFGFLFVALPFLGPLRSSPWLSWLIALIPLGLAAYWIRTEKRVPTQEEELETFLVEASRNVRTVGSLTRLLDQYREKGTDDLTLARIRGAPRLLRQRARTNIINGIVFSGAGLILALGSISIAMWKGGAPEIHLLKYGFFGAGLGLGHIAQGLRLKWCVRRFRLTEKPPIAFSTVSVRPPVNFDNDGPN